MEVGRNKASKEGHNSKRKGNKERLGMCGKLKELQAVAVKFLACLLQH